jgi:hypothetical protein
MRSEPLQDFIANHDDRWLFVVLYIGLAVVLSMLLSLFWLVAVAGLHFGLEVLRQRSYREGMMDTATHAVWEIKLDVALVLLALAMSLYMDLFLGILGLQSATRAAAATRAGARVARAAAWQRNLRAFVLLADDAFRVVQVGVTRLLRRQPAVVAVASGSPVSAAGTTPTGPGTWREGWSVGDRVTVALLAACALLIVSAPLLTDLTWSGATLTLLEQLRPFPAR